MDTTARDSARKEMTSFLVLTFAWTWAFWLGLWALCARGATSAGRPLFLAMHMLGGFGPTIMAVACVARRPGGKQVRAFLRTWLPGRLSGLGLLVLAAAVLLSLLKPLALALLGKGGLPLENWPLMLALFPAMIIGGGLEEPGWRGIVYDDSASLKEGRPLAHLAMALVWILWHLPLWLVPGTYQNLHLDLTAFALGVGATSLAFYAIRMSGASVGWCVLVHALVNAVIGAFGPAADAGADRLVSSIQLMAAIALFYGFLRLRARGAGWNGKLGGDDAVGGTAGPERPSW